MSSTKYIAVRRTSSDENVDDTWSGSNSSSEGSEGSYGSDDSYEKSFINDDSDSGIEIDYNNLSEINEKPIKIKKQIKSCPNPLCDHKESTRGNTRNRKSKLEIAKQKPVEELCLDDLIELGKTYHCKSNKTYFDIDLCILCELVKPLIKLNRMIGMENVKKNIVDHIIFFLQNLDKKENCGECINCVFGRKCVNNQNREMLHTVITGPPGVGKSELGKILAEIYKSMGILSKGNMYIATRPDLIGDKLGETSKMTQAFIDKCEGSVMFIDECYSLGHSSNDDSYSKECIDTLTKNLSEKTNFLCIIAGYYKETYSCFFAVNRGLERRFTFRYDIKGYTPKELLQIFIMKVSNSDWELDLSKEELKKLESIFITNKKKFPHFGGDIETLLLNCKIYHARRVLFLDSSHRKKLTMEDITYGINNFSKHRETGKDKDESNNINFMYM